MGEVGEGVKQPSLSEKDGFEGGEGVGVLAERAEGEGERKALESVGVDAEAEGACEGDVACLLPVAGEAGEEREGTVGFFVDPLVGEGGNPVIDVDRGDGGETVGASELGCGMIDHGSVAVGEVGGAWHDELRDYLGGAAAPSDRHVVAVDDV